MNQKVKKIALFLLTIYDYLCDGCFRISGWMIFGMALSIGYDVLMRYFFKRPTAWVADFADYTLLYTTFLASAWLLKHDEHVNLTILIDHLSPMSRRVMRIITSFFSAIVCGFIIWYGVAESWEALERSMKMDRAIPIPKYFIFAIIPFGCLLLFIQFVRNAINSLTGLKDRSHDE
jgi:TRAP-type C4-dicarboxylate transport system permease small subunit